jgi:WD40 repeat protein/Tfp pilus assembly protein PilF/V8-like Glu-specific endopeptidase
MGSYAPAQAEPNVKQIAKAVTIKITSSSSKHGPGSGIIVNKQGDEYTILTNAHVLCGSGINVYKLKQCGAKPNYYTIYTPDARQYQAPSTTVVKIGNELDIAIVKFRSPINYPVAQFAKSLQVGNQAQVFSAGFPGSKNELKFESGKVVANVSNRLNGDSGGYTMLYDVETLPGMSGSGVFNSEGQVVAIHGRGDVFQDGTETGDVGNWRVGNKIGVNRGIPISQLKVVNNQVTAVNSNISEPSTADGFLIASFNKFVTPDPQKIASDKRTALNSVSKAISKQPNYLHAYLLRGWIYTQLQDYKKALSDLDKGVALNSNYYASYLLRSTVKTAMNDSKGASSDIDRAVQLKPDSTIALENRGVLRLSAKNTRGALEDFNRVLSIDSSSITGLVGKCNANAGLGNYQNALEDCGKVIEKFANSRSKSTALASAYSGRGIARFKRGDKKGALQDLDAAIEQDSQNPSLYINRASIRYSMGNRTEALADFKKALSLGSTDINAYLGVGLIEEEEGNIEEAISAYEKAAAVYSREGNFAGLEVVKYRMENLRKKRTLGVRTSQQASARKPKLDRAIRTDYRLAYSVDGISLPEVSFGNQSFDDAMRNTNEAEEKLRGSSSMSAFSPSGQILATGDSEGDLSVWQLQGNGQFSKVFTQNLERSIRAIAVSSNDRILAVGIGLDIVVRRLSDGQNLSYLNGHRGIVTSLVMSPDGQTLVSGSSDKTIKVWQLSDGKLLHSIQAHRATVNSVVISPDGKSIISGSTDGTIKIWRLQDGLLLRTIAPGKNPNRVNSVAISPDGKNIIGAGDSINLWTLETGKLSTTIQSEFTHSVAISPNGQTFITGDMGGKIRVWRLSDGKLLRTIDGHRSWVMSVAISPDGSTLVSSSRDRNIRIWQVDRRTK